MTILPADIDYGCVDGRFILAIGDTSADIDRHPDPKPAQGSITFQPLQQRIISPPGGGEVISTTVLPQPITCSLDSEGRLIDSDGERQAWFIVGHYRVTFSLIGVALPEVTVVIEDTHTSAAPLDLSGELPPLPEPGVVWVVSEEAYLASIAEANRAEMAADRAEAAASGDLINDAATNPGTVWSSTKTAAELGGKANTSHTHSIPNVTGLQTALNDKAASVHSHAISGITGLQGALDDKAEINDAVESDETTWSSEKIAAEIGEGGGGGGGGGVMVVYQWTGSAWPTIPTTPPAGIKIRLFDSAGDPNATPYVGPTWAGVTDWFILPESA